MSKSIRNVEILVFEHFEWLPNTSTRLPHQMCIISRQHPPRKIQTRRHLHASADLREVGAARNTQQRVAVDRISNIKKTPAHTHARAHTSREAYARKKKSQNSRNKMSTASATLHHHHHVCPLASTRGDTPHTHPIHESRRRCLPFRPPTGARTRHIKYTSITGQHSSLPPSLTKLQR